VRGSRQTAAGLQLLQGEKLISVYRSAGGATKAFCSMSGSSLFGGTWPEGSEISVRLGSLDGDPGMRPQYHSFVGSKAPWDELPDYWLPQFEEQNPDE